MRVAIALMGGMPELLQKAAGALEVAAETHASHACATIADDLLGLADEFPDLKWGLGAAYRTAHSSGARAMTDFVFLLADLAGERRVPRWALRGGHDPLGSVLTAIRVLESGGEIEAMLPPLGACNIGDE